MPSSRASSPRTGGNSTGRRPAGATAVVHRADVVAWRFRRHQLDRPADAFAATDVDLLELGVQDTGTEGHRWALAVRGARPAEPDELFLAWTVRGAPHAYRRADANDVIVATAPFSEADAGSRVFDASTPLRAAGIEVLDALRTVAKEQRDIVRRPVVKGEVSSELSRRLPEPYLRWCRSCRATHSYEQTFRLAALQAGLVLDADTSPPVLRRLPGLRPRPLARLGDEAPDRFHVVRNYLRFYGPASVKAIATFLEAPVKQVQAQLPDDAVEVRIEGVEEPKAPPRYALEGDVHEIAGAGSPRPGTVRLVGSHDPYLQLRDRQVLVAPADRRKDLWRVLGRPGAALVDGEVAATWRPRAAGKGLTVQVEPWGPMSKAVRAAVQQEAERLASYRGVTLRAVEGT